MFFNISQIQNLLTNNVLALFLAEQINGITQLIQFSLCNIKLYKLIFNYIKHCLMEIFVSKCCLAETKLIIVTKGKFKNS